MKNLLLLLILPFLSFGQCIDGDMDQDGICDEVDDCVGTWIADVITGDCSQFTSLGADFCNSYSGCEWTYSWGGWVTGGSSDCVGSYEDDQGYCDELELTGCQDNDEMILNILSFFMNDPEWGFSGCSNIIPYLESQTLIPLSCDTDLTNYGFVNMNVADICECSCAEYLNLDNHILMNRKKINTLSIIGQQSNNIHLQLDIYDDGSVEKKYVIK